MKIKYFSYSGSGRVYCIKIGRQPYSFVGVGVISRCTDTTIPAYNCIPIYNSADSYSTRQLGPSCFTIQNNQKMWTVSESYLLNANETIDIRATKRVKLKSDKEKDRAKAAKKEKTILSGHRIKTRKQKDNSLNARSKRISQYLESVSPNPWNKRHEGQNNNKKDFTYRRSSYWGENSIHAFQGGGCSPK